MTLQEFYKLYETLQDLITERSDLDCKMDKLRQQYTATQNQIETIQREIRESTNNGTITNETMGFYIKISEQ